MEEAQRLQKLPIYVFAKLDHLKAEAVKKGIDLIDLGMGNPDISPPKQVIDALVAALQDPQNHRYPSFEGAPEFKEAVAGWCKRQYGIGINPHNEVVTLIGSKEGLIHLAFAFINFMLDGKNSAELTNLIGSGNPNLDAMPFIKPEIVANTAIFPDRERLAKLEMLKDLDRNKRRVLSRMWTEIKLR